MTDVLPVRTLNHRDKVSFIPGPARFGRAMFTFCMHWKRGKPDKIYIRPRQQPDATESFVIENTRSNDISIGSWTYKGIAPPKIWLHGWCKEHKGTFLQVYVPDNSNYFQVHIFSNISINFGYENPDKRPRCDHGILKTDYCLSCQQGF